jgi:hypothetical protein
MQLTGERFSLNFNLGEIPVFLRGQEDRSFRLVRENHFTSFFVPFGHRATSGHIETMSE